MSNSTPFVEMLGDKLMQGDKQVDTAEVLKDKKAVAFYFSAHWCPPCRGFTPQLANWYRDDLKAKGLEVIFVSSDRDESSFKDYFEKEQPWLALPFGEREKKNDLSKKYGVRGIPSLVVVDGPAGKAPGQTITKDGRAAVSEDPKGADFPWYPPTLQDLLKDAEFLAKTSADGSGTETKTVGFGEALQGKTVGLYFSAHWCPPCKMFTPQLASTYAKLKFDQKKDFEIVFASSDRDEAQFTEYYNEMPWLALKFDDAGKKTKAALSRHFGVQGIPSLVILKVPADGSADNIEVVREDARGAVGNDPEGKEFPWVKKPVNDLNEDPDGIDEQPSVVLLMDDASGAMTEEDKQKLVEEVLKPLAEEFIEAGKKGGEPAKFNFFHVSKPDGQLGDRVREECGCDDWKPSKSGRKWQLVLMDIQDNGGYYRYDHEEANGADLSKEALKGWLAEYTAKKLKREQMG